MDKKLNVVFATVVVCALLASVVVLALSSLNVLHSVDGHGKITSINLGVFSDSACTQPCSSLDFGMVDNGESYTYTVYVKNTGNFEETLGLVVNGWNPSQVGTLTWNREGYVLSVDGSVEATLTFTVYADTGAVEDFYCNVTFAGVKT